MRKRSFYPVVAVFLVATLSLAAEEGAHTWYEQGVEHFARREWKPAIEAFTQAIQAKPDYAEAYAWRGRAHAFAGENDDGLSDSNRAIELAPDLAFAFYVRGLVYLNKKDMDAAIADYTRAISLDPNFAVAYNNRAIAYQNKGEQDAAIADYTRAIFLDPNLAIAYYNRAIAYQNKGERDVAIADYTRTISLDPNFAAAYNNRGLVYFGKREFEAAIADYTQAIALNPKDSRAYNRRGNAYRDKGDRDAALADYTRAIFLDPNLAATYDKRDTVHFSEQEFDAAIAAYTQAISLNPNDAWTHNSRGNAYRNKGDLNTAIVDYTRAISLNPEYAVAYYNRGKVYADRGDLDAAIADYTRANSLNNSSESTLAEAYLRRGMGFAGKGKQDLAASDFTEAAWLNRGLFGDRLSMTRGLGRPEGLEAAFEAVKASTEQHPRDATSWFNLGVIYQFQGHYDKAFESVNRALELDPAMFAALVIRAFEHYDRDDFDEAAANFEKILSLRPGNKEATDGLRHAYSKLAEENFREGNYEAALSNYSLAIALKRTFFALYDRARLYYSLGDPDAALRDLTELVGDSFCQYKRGNVYFDKGEYEAAIADYSEAIPILRPLVEEYGEYAPFYYFSFYLRGVAYYNTGDLEAAFRDISQAITLAPDTKLYAYKKEEDTETEDPLGGPFEASLPKSLRHGFASAWLYRGRIHYSRGEYYPAIQDLTRADSLILPQEDEELRQALDAAMAGWKTTIIPQEPLFWYNLGLEHVQGGQGEAAIEDFTKAAALKPDFAEARNERGKLYLSMQEENIAIMDFARALSIQPDLREASANLAKAYFNRSNRYAWDDYESQIVDLNKSLSAEPGFTEASGRLAELYCEQAEKHYGSPSNWDKDLDMVVMYYAKALELKPDYLEALRKRGGVYMEKLEYSAAIADYTKVLSLDPEDTHTSGFLRNAYQSRGLESYRGGKLDEALADCNHALSFDSDSTGALYLRAIVYKDQELYDEATADLNRFLSLTRWEYERSDAWNLLGNIYWARGLRDEAAVSYTKAIDMYSGQITALMNRGRLYWDAGKPEEALGDFEKIFDKTSTKRWGAAFGYSWNLVLDVYRRFPYLPLSMRSGSHELKYAEIARKSLERAIENAEELRADGGTTGAKTMERALYLYYGGVDFEAFCGNPEKAFEYSEQLRSRGFLEQMGTEAALRLPGITKREREEARKLLQLLEKARAENAYIQSPGEAERSTMINRDLQKVEHDLLLFDWKLGRRLPRYAELRNPKPVGIAEAKSWCGENTAVLEYVLWDESIDYKPIRGNLMEIAPSRPSINSYCLVITGEGVRAVRLDPAFDYAAEVNGLRDLVKSLAPLEDIEPYRNRLYAALIKPVMPHIPQSVTRLLVVPDGSLAHLPFDLLREEGGKELGERYRVSFSPSVSVSVLAAGRGGVGKERLLAFGGAWYARDKAVAVRGERAVSFGEETLEGVGTVSGGPRWWDLPGTEAEVKGLEELGYREGAPKVMLGKEASEGKVKELSLNGELKGYGLVHFAGHGYFNEEDIGRSGIVLSEVSGLIESEEDGYLTISEAAVLEMGSRIVVLSGCETGLGKVKRGDGVVGLARAFMVAGSDGVGVSLWSISDEATVEFMRGVYGRVIEGGKSFGEAYQEEKWEFRGRGGEWRHPYYWAGFMLYE